MITSGSFPTIVAWLFLTILSLVPAISLVFLKREQKKISEGSYRKPITALFVAEVWLWLIAAAIEAFILIQFLGFYLYIKAHSQATGNEGVPPTALMLVFGSEALLVLAGLGLHWFMKQLMH
jgi:mannose/fructose/N-acetylgalactosamine-specific phosphotransferase system component IIC